jgi:hypothetical protein
VDERASALEGLVTQEEWNGRRVLITGHTGFKGAWLTLWLAKRVLGRTRDTVHFEALSFSARTAARPMSPSLRSGGPDS